MEKNQGDFFLNRIIRRIFQLPSEQEPAPPTEPVSFEGSRFNLRAYRALSILRYLTLLLTSLVFLLGPYGLFTTAAPLAKLVLVIVLFGLAALSVRAYALYQRKNQAVKVLAFLETIGITGLVIYTGGLGSPFVWYMLIPLVLSSMHLPYPYTWAFLLLFLSGSLMGDLYLQGATALSINTALLGHLDILLIFPLLTLVTQVFSRIYYTLAEQSHQLETQQEELVGAYIDLSKNHQLMQTLSDFQSNAVTCKKEHDVYTRLIAACTYAFPLEWAVVLELDEPLFPQRNQSFGDYRLIGDGKVSKKHVEARMAKEIRDRWQELFQGRGVLLGEDQNWLALPIRLEKRKTVAIFLAQTKDMNSRNQSKETLVFFIQFTEQLIQSLRNFRQTEETLQHLSDIYEAVETVSRRSDPREILDLFCTYARSLTGSEKIIFWVESIESEAGSSDGSESIYSVKGKIDVFPEEYWQEPLLRAWAEIKDNPVPLVQVIEDEEDTKIGQMVCVPVKSWARCFGLMAALHGEKNYSLDETMQKLTFMAKMGAIAIERNLTEIFTDKLLVLEEQKRIANEIHDSISQNLFSIVYGLESVSKHSQTVDSRLKRQITSIQEVASRTAKELRVLIYRLSPRKRGDDTFVKEIRNYLDGLANINDVEIDFQVEGTEEYLNPAMRSAFYRIIKEATGNSIRHGQCSTLQVKLEMTPFTANLDITDNGNGFDVEGLYEQNRFNGGLGILNMQELIHSLQGSFKIQSTPGEETRVSCHVPTSPVSQGKAASR